MTILCSAQKRLTALERLAYNAIAALRKISQVSAGLGPCSVLYLS